MSKQKFADFLKATIADEAVGHHRPLRTLMLAAQDSSRHALSRQINNMLRRAKVVLDQEQEINPVLLDQQLAASNVNVSDRLALKTALAIAGVLR